MGLNNAHANVINRTLVSKDAQGEIPVRSSETPSISNNGSYIAYASSDDSIVLGYENDEFDIFLYDIENELNTIISVNAEGDPANGSSVNPRVSINGQFVVFESTASNLVDGDTNDVRDIFLYDIENDTIDIVSLSDDEQPLNCLSEYPSVSENGRYVSFSSCATNAVTNDTNLSNDLFVRDRLSQTTTRVSLGSGDTQLLTDTSLGSISADGVYAVFSSDGVVYVRNMESDNVKTIELAGKDIFTRINPISYNNRYIIFEENGGSYGYGLYVYDLETDDYELYNKNYSGDLANNTSYGGAISYDGRYISFISEASNLVSDDTNEAYDIFVKDRILNTVRRINIDEYGNEMVGTSIAGVDAFSGNGRYAVISNNLYEGEDEEVQVVYLLEISDDDGIESIVEDDAPNNGDVDENNYNDAIEENITSFINDVSGSYTTVKTTGECVSNNNMNVSTESDFDTQDGEYNYPLGIISFEVNCKDTGETATVSVFCFCENTPVEGTIARKYNEGTREYTTIEDAVIEEVTIDGQRALKMTYDVVDGGELDEDGLENGTIVDPVGFARASTPTESTSSRSSSGSRPTRLIAQNTVIPVETQNPSNDACTKSSFTTLMKKGSKFGEVSKLQEALNTLGFNSGIPDGLFGPMTDMAVKAFQSANTLDSDGIVGPMTREGLNGKCL